MRESKATHSSSTRRSAAESATGSQARSVAALQSSTPRVVAQARAIGAMFGAALERPRPPIPTSVATAPFQFIREWATGKMDKALDEAGRSAGDPDIDTGHHKASKSVVMQKVYDAMTPKQWQRTIQVLDLEPGSGVNALKSLGSNLAIGPSSGKRLGDPNRDLDPNVTRSGTLTPRSTYYEELAVLMAGRRNGEAKFTDEEFDRVLGLLHTAEVVHLQKTGGELIDDDLSMWEKGEFEGGKTWRKTPTATDYRPDFEALEGRSVRDLKLPAHQASVPRREFVQKIFPKISVSLVTPLSTPLDQDALDRWKADGFTRFYRISDRSWYFVEREVAKGTFVRNPDFVLMHFPDTPEMEQEIYGFQLLRPNLR